MPRMNKVEPGATRGDSRHPASGSPVGRPARNPAPPYAKGIGDSRAKARDAGETPKGSSGFSKASDTIVKYQH